MKIIIIIIWSYHKNFASNKWSSYISSREPRDDNDFDDTESIDTIYQAMKDVPGAIRDIIGCQQENVVAIKNCCCKFAA